MRQGARGGGAGGGSGRMGSGRGGRGGAKPGRGILRTGGQSLNSQEASQPYSQNMPLTQGMSQVCGQD
jgi:hypothetical protein